MWPVSALEQAQRNTKESLDLLRTALATPPPEPPPTNGPNNSDVTELFYRHMGEGSEVGFENAIAEVLTRWGHPATPPPEPPTAIEIIDLSIEIDDAGLGIVEFARAVLERWGDNAI